VDSSFVQVPPFEYLKAPVFLFAHKTMSGLPARIDDAKEAVATATTKRMPILNF
jgi:hypothetical protein